MRIDFFVSHSFSLFIYNEQTIPVFRASVYNAFFPPTSDRKPLNTPLSGILSTHIINTDGF